MNDIIKNRGNKMGKDFKFLIYQTDDEDVSVRPIIKDETIWLTQKMMAELFGVNVPAISKHLKNIFDEGELEEKVTVSKMEIVTPHGAIADKKRVQQVTLYNLDAIISVGYRINSGRATQFRIWATKVLREYVTKGFVLDDERLKQGEVAFQKDYFRELLERVRSIRASERRIWLQITDIFKECSIDYDKDSETTREFYAMMQNRFFYAITGKTAPEIIYDGADKDKLNMGLTTWKNAPDGRILKSDTSVAKNYLDEKQIRKLERSVSGFFDYVEDLIEQERTFTMQDFSDSINKFLEFRNYKILDGKGRVSRKMAEEKAFNEYDEFNKTQKIDSDFEKEVKKILDEGYERE